MFFVNVMRLKVFHFACVGRHVRPNVIVENCCIISSRISLQVVTGVFCFYLVKHHVLERQSHELYLGEKEKLKLIVTEPDTALAAEEEAFEEKLSPTKVNKSCNPLQSFAVVV